MVSRLVSCVALGYGLVVGSASACDRGMFVVAVDPGHNLESPGTISARGIPEAQFNARLAEILMDELKKREFTQVFSTNTKGDAALTDRAKMANERGANLFVSLHHDSVQRRYLSTWTYDGKRRPYSDVFSGYSLFFSEKNGDAKRSLDFAKLVGTEFLRKCLTPTLHHAEHIQGENRPLIEGRRGIYEFDDLVVLKSTNMPAILIEAGLIVNRSDEILLGNPVYQKVIASSIAQAVVKFCEAEASDAKEDLATKQSDQQLDDDDTLCAWSDPRGR